MYIKLHELILRYIEPRDGNLPAFRAWLDRMLSITYLIAAVLGLPNYIIALQLAEKPNGILAVIVSTLAYLWVMGNVFIYKLSYKARIYGLLLCIYFIGIILIYFMAPSGPGPIWLFFFTMLSGLFMGYRGAITSLLILMFTTFAPVYLSFGDNLPWLISSDYSSFHWTIFSLNFFMMASAASFLLASLKEHLNKKVNLEEKYLSQIRDESMKLKSSNAQLTREIAEKEFVENELLKSEDRLKRGQEAAKVGSWELNINTSMIWGSEEAFNIFGINRDLPDIPSDMLAEMIYNEDFQQFIEQFKESMDEGKRFDMTFRIINKRTNNIIWVRAIAERNTGLLREDPVLVGIVQDVTENMNIQNELRKTALQYQTLFETANDAIFIMDQDIFLECNSKTLSLYGYDSKDEIIYNRPYIISPEFQPDGQPSKKKALEMITRAMNGETMVFEWVHQKKNGDLFDAEVSLNHISIEGMPRVLAIVRDITNRKKAEYELRKSEERQALALEASSVGLWDWNVATGEVFFSSRYYEMLGYKQGDFDSTVDEWHNRLYPEDKGVTLQFVNEFITKGKDKYEIEFRMIRSDGEKIWVMSRGKVVERDEEGKPLRITGTHTDITQRKKYENKILRLNEELESRVKERTEALQDAMEELKFEIEEKIKVERSLLKANEEIENSLRHEKELHDLKIRFMSMISHEYRSPLTVILSSSYILGMLFESQSKAEFAAHLKNIQQSVKTLTDLLDDVLMIGRSSTDEIDLKKESIEITDFTKTIVHETIIGDNRDRSIEVISDSSQIIARIDPSLFRLILINLLRNALIFSNSNDEIIVSLFEGDSDFEIHLTDHGRGIPEEDVSKVFEPFHRGKNVGTMPGKGLGLTIVKHHVEVLGGSIYFESKLNEGTTFKLKFPKS